MPATSSRISLFFDGVSFTLKNRTVLKSFIEGLFKAEKTKLASLNYIFCSDKRLLEINRQYLDHDYYTDIITFDLSESDEIAGEIYISIERVKENARSLGVNQKNEILRVMIHGALHLCGYGDSTNRQKLDMRHKEDLYLKKFQSY